MADTQTPADLQAALSRAKADPRVAAAAKAWTDYHDTHGVWNPGHGTLGPQADFMSAIKSYLPPGYHAVMGQDGQPVLKKDGLPSWIYPVAAMAIGLTAGAATGAFAGPAAAASAAGNAGIGGAGVGVGVGDAGLAASIGAPAATAASIEAGAGATVPTIAGRTIGSGMAKTAPSLASGGSDWVNKAIQTAGNAAPAIGALVGGAGGKPGISPEASAMLDQQRSRMEQANPLYESVMRLAFNRLPTSAQQGLSVPTYDQANASVPQVDPGGSYAEDPATRNLMRTQLVRSKMSDPMLQAVLRLAQGRMPGGA